MTRVWSRRRAEPWLHRLEKQMQVPLMQLSSPPYFAKAAIIPSVTHMYAFFSFSSYVNL